MRSERELQLALCQSNPRSMKILLLLFFKCFMVGK